MNICVLVPPNHGVETLGPPMEVFFYLAKFGHRLTWIFCSGKTPGERRCEHENTRIYTIPYIASPATISQLSISYALKVIPHYVRRINFVVRTIRKGGYELLLIKEGCGVLDGLLAMYMRRKYNVRYIFQGINPLEMQWEQFKIEGKRPKPLYYLMAKLNRLLRVYTMRKADIVLPVGKWCGQALIQQARISSAKVIAFPQPVDVRRFVDNDGDSIRNRYHLDNSGIIVYVGTLARARHLSILIQALSEVKGENVKLLMVGDGSDRQNLERLAEALGVKQRVIFTGQVPKSEIPNFIAAANVGISPVPPSSFYKVSSPIKLLEYMAAARAVIANEEIPEQKEVLTESGGGILVPFEPEAFARALVDLLGNPEKAAEMGRKGREWVTKNRCYEVVARRIEEALGEIVAKPNIKQKR